MRVIRAFGFLLAAVAVYFLGMTVSPSFSLYLDVFLVVVVLQALSGDTLGAILLGLAAGIVQDALPANGPLGFGVANTLVAYGTARLAQRLVIQKATSVLGVVAFASIVQQTLLVSLAWLLLPDPSLPLPWQVAVKALASGILGMILYAAAQRFTRARDAKRLAGATGRLRLG
jgi:hypothetical protein